MGGDGAHGRDAVYQRSGDELRNCRGGPPWSPLRSYLSSNFFSRNSVILLCSAAAMVSSACVSCLSLSRSAASISSEVLPVAQIMKMKPNLCSYSWFSAVSDETVV